VRCGSPLRAAAISWYGSQQEASHSAMTTGFIISIAAAQPQPEGNTALRGSGGWRKQGGRFTPNTSTLAVVGVGRRYAHSALWVVWAKPKSVERRGGAGALTKPTRLSHANASPRKSRWLLSVMGYGRCHFAYNGPLELAAPRSTPHCTLLHTAVKTQRRGKKCHVPCAIPDPSSPAARSPVWPPFAFIACCLLLAAVCGITCAIQSFFREKRHRLLVCRPDLRFNNATRQ
jgi:hypothetical protein